MSEVNQEEMDAADALLRKHDPLRRCLMLEVECPDCSSRWHIAICPGTVLASVDEVVKCQGCHGIKGVVVRWYECEAVE